MEIMGKAIEIEDIAALIGAITGPLGLLLASLVYFRDRSKVKISLGWNMVMTNGYGNSDKKHCSVTVCNIGRRPIYLSHVHFQVPKEIDPENYSLLFTDGIDGATLPEGSKPYTVTAEQDSFDLNKLKKAWWRVRVSVIDAAGKHYHSDWPIVAPKWAEDVKAPLGAILCNKIKNQIRKRLP